MQTKLDDRDELMAMIDKLNLQDRQKLIIFLTGLEAGKEVHISGKPNEQKNKSDDNKSE